MVNTKEIYYRQAKLNDIPSLISLMNSQYNRKREEKYFIWQFFNSVYPTILIVAEFRNSIIGMLGLQIRKLTNDAKVGQVIDMLLNIDFRGIGVFTKMINTATEIAGKPDAICVLPNLNGKNAIAKLGWKVIANINDLIHEGPISLKIENLKTQWIESVEFDYLEPVKKWRFLEHPEHKYFYIDLDELNFSISKIFQDPVTKEKCGDIVYLKFDNVSKLNELYIKNIRFLNGNGASLISTWALQHLTEYKILCHLGFQIKRRERYFCLNIINPKFNDLYNVNNWRLYQSDAEMY